MPEGRHREADWNILSKIEAQRLSHELRMSERGWYASGSSTQYELIQRVSGQMVRLRPYWTASSSWDHIVVEAEFM
jgi:hypothetical protein